MLELHRIGNGTSRQSLLPKLVRTCMNIQGHDLGEEDIELLILDKMSDSRFKEVITSREVYDSYMDISSTVHYTMNMVDNKVFSPNHNVLIAIAHNLLRSKVSNSNEFYNERYLDTISKPQDFCVEFTRNIKSLDKKDVGAYALAIYKLVQSHEFFVQDNDVLACLMMNGFLLGAGMLVVSSDKTTSSEFSSSLSLQLAELAIFS